MVDGSNCCNIVKRESNQSQFEASKWSFYIGCPKLHFGQRYFYTMRENKSTSVLENSYPNSIHRRFENWNFLFIAWNLSYDFFLRHFIQTWNVRIRWQNVAIYWIFIFRPFDVRSAIKWPKKKKNIVWQILVGRCRGETSIFKTADWIQS